MLQSNFLILAPIQFLKKIINFGKYVYHRSTNKKSETRIRNVARYTWRASRSINMNITRLEARLAPPEAVVEAAEVRGPRRFRTLLGKTSASPP